MKRRAFLKAAAAAAGGAVGAPLVVPSRALGADGYFQPLFNKRTGEIDQKVAQYWRDNYDLAHILEREEANRPEGEQKGIKSRLNKKQQNAVNQYLDAEAKDPAGRAQLVGELLVRGMHHAPLAQQQGRQALV